MLLASIFRFTAEETPAMPAIHMEYPNWKR